MINTASIERLPFSFRLEDRQELSAIYMVDPDKQLAQRLNLYIENTENQTLFFANTQLEQNPPSRDHCHFELRFRRGVLSDSSLGKSSPKGTEKKSMELLITGKYQKKAYVIGSWVISEPDDHSGTKPYVSFYLARAEKGSGGRFMPGERQRLVLTNISADPEGDTAETRVELIPRQLYYGPPLQENARPVTESREQNVVIVNHLGKEQIPLHVAFIGTYAVRNDSQPQGQDHRLKMRITNISRHSTITFTEKSRFLFAFNFSDGDEEEALGKPGDISKIRFYVDRVEDVKELRIHPDMAQNPIWALNKELGLDQRTLAPHEHIDILLDTAQLVTASPAGLTALHITYEGIPGYWDGKLLAELEKTPLVVRQVKEGNHEIVEMDSGNRTLRITGNNHSSEAGEQARLEVMGNTVLEGKTIIKGKLEAGDDTLIRGQASIGKKLEVGDDAAIQGNTSVGKKLEVGHDTLIRGQASVNGKMEVGGDTFLKGKVGIGTPAPEESLHVNGKAILTGDLNVGGNGNAKVITRHIEGKNYINSAADDLYLNYYTGKDVHTGKSDTPSSLYVSGRVHDKTGDLMPVGSIIAFGGQNIPKGWLECNGQTIDPDRYGDLCRVLGKIKEVGFKSEQKSEKEKVDTSSLSTKIVSSFSFLGVKRTYVDIEYKYVQDSLEYKEIYKVPDLRSRFIVGEGQGKPTLTIKNQRITVSGNKPDYEKDFNVNKLFQYSRKAYSLHDSASMETFASSKDNYNNFPPYYALRYIIKY